jgi:homoserine kinase type II
VENNLKHSEIAVIAAEYFTNINWEFSKIESGSSNSTYRINLEGQAYVLSIFESQNSDHVDELTSILKLLEQRGIRSSRVVTTKDGRLHSTFNGKPVLLKEFIAGEELTHATVTSPVASDIGGELARLHESGVFESRKDTQHYGPKIIDGIAAGLPQGKFRNWFVAEFERLSAEFPEDLPKGYVHSDVFPDNVIIEDGQFKCLLDFEYLSYFPRVFDLSCGIVGLTWSDGKLNIDLARSLISGYEAERPLELREKEALNYFCQYITLFFAGWRYRQFNISFPNPERAEDYLEMIDMLEVFKNQTPGILESGE